MPRDASIARRAFVTLIVLVSLTTMDACAILHRGGTATAQEDTIVEVHNQSFPDVVIYAIVGGSDPRRLGMVTGNSTDKFKVPAQFLGVGTLQLLARPIAGRSYLLPAVSVSPGDQVDVTISNVASQSTVTVAPR